MVTDSMTFDEIANHLALDAKEIHINKHKNLPKLRLEVSKIKKFPANLKYRHFKSKNHNHWFSLSRAFSRNIPETLKKFDICIYRNQHGLNAAGKSINRFGPCVCIYTAHFFKRYKERANKKESGLKLILKYFRNNYILGMDYFTKGDNDVDEPDFYYIHSLSREGVCLGFTTTENNMIYKTFITADMAKGDQIDRFSDLKNIINED